LQTVWPLYAELGILSKCPVPETTSAEAFQLLPYIGYPRTLNALRVIGEVVPAIKATGIATAAR
jgi:hypothetical protein